MSGVTDQQAPSRAPKSSRANLRVTFWGTRGSVPVSGSEHLVYGGDTICIEIEAASSRVIVDAGSGLIALGKDLVRRGIQDVDIVLTHYHLDHLLGLMSFAPLFRKGCSLRIHAPLLEGGAPQHALARLFDRPYFPLSAFEAGAQVSILPFRPGDQLSIGQFSLSTCGLFHPGGACGYRMEHAGRAVVSVLDHEHGRPEIDRHLEAFANRADLVLFDGTWDEQADYQAHRGWGHSTWQAGLGLVQSAGAGQLVCLHHAPSSDDQTLAMREQALRVLAPRSMFARQKQTIVLG